MVDRKFLILFVILLCSPIFDSVASEDFKGSSPAGEYTFGLIGGLGVLDSSAGFAVIGNAAKKIIHQGFVPEINNQVWVEFEAGPLFVSGSSAFIYSAHLRWDFHKDQTWTFYGLGGLGGNITGEKLGSHWELFPRFGVGAFCKVNPQITLRGELSHELFVAGVSFSL